MINTLRFIYSFNGCTNILLDITGINNFISPFSIYKQFETNYKIYINTTDKKSEKITYSTTPEYVNNNNNINWVLVKYNNFSTTFFFYTYNNFFELDGEDDNFYLNHYFDKTYENLVMMFSIFNFNEIGSVNKDLFKNVEDRGIFFLSTLFEDMKIHSKSIHINNGLLTNENRFVTETICISSITVIYKEYELLCMKYTCSNDDELAI